MKKIPILYLICSIMLVITGCAAEETVKEADSTAVLIAPELVLEDVTIQYDITSPDAVWVPELGAASGFLFYTDYIPSEGFPWYQYDNSVTMEDAVLAMEEYFNLLAELPYFTVVKPLTCEFGYIYSGALAYVGNGKVTAVQDDFYCSEPFAFAFYMNTEKREVATQYGKGLQILDTGHRLACGADYTTQKIFGDRVGDAYYYQDGVYYNGSDRALMAKSGECAVLLNGETCVGITDSYMGVRNCVEGFHRSDWIEIFLRENYPMDEDIYTMEDLLQYKTNPYVTTTTDDMTVFSLSDKGAYSDFVQPLPSRESKYRGVTVRVLQWDMEGDIVLYFYGDINMTGAPYEIEGLYVAKPRMEEESAENSGDGSRSCPACFNGDCSNCNGSGYVYSSFADTTLDCSLCTGGRCSRCGGSGRLAD